MKALFWIRQCNQINKGLARLFIVTLDLLQRTGVYPEEVLAIFKSDLDHLHFERSFESSDSYIVLESHNKFIFYKVI